MSKYILTEEGRLGLQEIWNYIADQDVDAADKVLRSLRSAMQKLSRIPAIGHRRADIKNPRYRFWVVYSYVIAYLPDTSPLQIVRVVHGARNIKRILTK